MRLTVQLFAVLRDLAGTDRVDIDLPDDASVHAVVEAVGQRFPAMQPMLKRTAAAVNLAYAQSTDILHPGDEVALIPPVSGG